MFWDKKKHSALCFSNWYFFKQQLCFFNNGYKKCQSTANVLRFAWVSFYFARRQEWRCPEAFVAIRQMNWLFQPAHVCSDFASPVPAAEPHVFQLNACSSHLANGFCWDLLNSKFSGHKDTQCVDTQTQHADTNEMTNISFVMIPSCLWHFCRERANVIKIANICSQIYRSNKVWQNDSP